MWRTDSNMMLRKRPNWRNWGIKKYFSFILSFTWNRYTLVTIPSWWDRNPGLLVDSVSINHCVDNYCLILCRYKKPGRKLSSHIKGRTSGTAVPQKFLCNFKCNCSYHSCTFFFTILHYIVTYLTNTWRAKSGEPLWLYLVRITERLLRKRILGYIKDKL